MGLSGLCLVHCVGTTVMLALLSAAGGVLGAPIIHEVGLGLAMIMGAYSLGRGIVEHGYAMPSAVGGLGLGPVLDVAQDDDGSLPGRQPADGVPEVLVVAGLASGADVRPGPLWHGSRGLLAMPTPTPPRGGRRGEDAPDVVLGVTLDPLPREPRLAQRRLEQVLGGRLVADEQVRRAEQGR